MSPTKPNGRRRLTIPLVLLWGLLLVLALAGGASRADALGQAVVRPAAALVLVGLVLARAPIRASGHGWPVGLLAAIIAVPLIQLIPFPPAVWLAMPGRNVFSGLAALAGVDQPWRPIAMVPDAALNAFLSLLVPLAAMLTTLALTGRERSTLPGAVLVLAVASAFVALLQVSGAGGDNPLINETLGTAAGVFANPNHQALLLAVGLLAAAGWATGGQTSARSRRRSGEHWRMLVAGGACVWFLLMIMATGSRTGLLMGAVAFAVALVQLRPMLTSALSRLPRRVRLVAASGGLATVVLLIATSFTAGRALSLNRLLALSTGEDMRSRALPTVVDMITRYMPVGTGVGSFDPLFRMHEPDALLKLTYFNHAHNDYLETALETGVPGVVLAMIGLVWAIRAAVRAWRIAPAAPDAAEARFGATTLLLILLASAVDYPARTPIIMAVTAMAAVLADRHGRSAVSLY